MENFIEYRLSNGTVLRVYPDENVFESPREWDNFGTMICFHKKYNLGDKHDFKTPEDFTNDIINKFYGWDYDVVINKKANKLYDNLKHSSYSDEHKMKMVDDFYCRMIHNSFKKASKKMVILPLYLYDHSGKYVWRRCF